MSSLLREKTGLILKRLLQAKHGEYSLKIQGMKGNKKGKGKQMLGLVSAVAYYCDDEFRSI